MSPAITIPLLTIRPKGVSMAAAEASAVRVLVVGEAWIKHTVHMKGFDHFQTTEYEAGDAVLVAGPAESGFNVTYLRAREISGRFPTTAEALGAYDVVCTAISAPTPQAQVRVDDRAGRPGPGQPVLRTADRGRRAGGCCPRRSALRA